MHIGKSENDTLCKDLHVGGWRIDVIDDAVTGEPKNKEYFYGDEKLNQRRNKPT